MHGSRNDWLRWSWSQGAVSALGRVLQDSQAVVGASDMQRSFIVSLSISTSQEIKLQDVLIVIAVNLYIVLGRADSFSGLLIND